jgi:AcrR family transcriptional regulator
MTATRSASARAKALAAATEIVREVGVPEFTVDEVSRRSGVAKTTIYRHWTNGTALMLEAIDCAIDSVPTPNTGSLRGDLQHLVHQFLGDAVDNTTSQMLCGLMYAAANDPEIHRAMQAFATEQHTPIKTIIQLAQGRGELHRDLDVDLAVDLIEGPLLWRFVLRREPVEPAAVAALIDMMIAGLSRPSGAAL